MSHPALRVIGVAALAAAGLTCTDEPSGVRRIRGAAFSIAPAFSEAPAGGPRIEVERIRGVLRGATDSTVVDATVEGDSVVLVFERVQVRGDSAQFVLGVSAFDANDELVFQSEDQVSVKPGDNSPAEPELEYTAPDASVDSIDVPGTTVELQWAGAIPGDLSCRNRAQDPGATTQAQLTVAGFAAGTPVSGVRVGWTSRDTSVATVDATGMVRARCANKATYVVARTFLDEADSILVSVHAPPFSLLMSPDSAILSRGASLQMTAVAVDEHGNATPVANPAWHSSDPARATVSSDGVVHAIANGRVQIVAASEGRITVGIVQVVRPSASGVIVTPGRDTAAVGNSRAFFAKATDATGRIIGDASGFTWSSSNPAVASVDAQSGHVRAHAVGDVAIVASLDGKADSAELRIEATLPPGAIRSRVVHAGTGVPIEGALISGPVSSTSSAADGGFVLTGLQQGDNVTVTKAGYVSVTLFDAPVYPNTTLQLPDAPMVPATGLPGHMTGSVTNAVTGNGVSGIAVNAYAGVNAGPSPNRPFATPVATTSTTSGGAFSFSNMAEGVYTLLFSGTGYSEAVSVGVVLGGTTEAHDPVLLAPATNAAGLAIVLTWGPCGETNVPCDLDLHLTGPTQPDTGRFHVHADARSYLVAGDSIAALDLMDATGPGPEVLGIRGAAAPGAYVLYVRNVSGAATPTGLALADSSFARIDVYQDNKVVATFFPPSGQAGTVWEVFTFDGARLTPANQMHADDSVITAPPGGGVAGSAASARRRQ